MKKKLLALLLAVATMACLVACGGQAGNTESESETGAGSASTWEETSDAEAFAQSCDFVAEFWISQGGDYVVELVVDDWDTGAWSFVANQNNDHIGHSGTNWTFDPEENMFSFEVIDNQDQHLFYYSAYDEASNTYYITYYRNWNEYKPILFKWTPDVKFVYSE